MLKSKDLEIEKATGFGIIYQLRNYEQVYSYEGEFKEVDKLEGIARGGFGSTGTN